MATKPNVKSFSATGEDGTALRLTVSTDIVDYMDSARAFGRENLADAGAHGRFQRRLIAIPDHKGGVLTPMVLSIGNANGLFLVRKESGAAGDGWRSIDLGAALAKTLGGAVQVRAVDAAWSDDDRIAVAVAVDSGDAAAPSRVFVAYDLSSAATDWNAVPWIDCGTRGAVRVSGIRVLDGGENGWMVVLDGSNGRLVALYLLRSKQRRSFAQAPVFNPAVDYQDIFDFQGAVEPETKSPGIVVLGQSGSGPVLSFRPFPEFKDDGTLGSVPPAWPLPCPAGANVLDVGLTRDGGTDLYVGGQGVHLIAAAEISNQEEAAVATIMSPEAAANVSRLSVADAKDGSAAAWALLHSGYLIVSQRADGSASWEPPIRLQKGVQDIGSVRGDRHVSTSLLLVYDDGKAGFILRNAGTEVWQESPLLVANAKRSIPVRCYETKLGLLSKRGAPQAGAKVNVSASVLTSVILNGRNIFIGPDLKAEAETDSEGRINVYDRARSLAPAVYRFAISGIAETLDVYPGGRIRGPFAVRTGRAVDMIEHVVVLMMENRSFDNLLGWLYDDVGNKPPRNIPNSGAPTFEGLSRNAFWNTREASKHDDPGAERVYATRGVSGLKGASHVGKYDWYNKPRPCPSEEYPSFLEQMFGTEAPAEGSAAKMNGFLANYIKAEAKDCNQIMECFAPDQLPVLSQLARSYAVCDRWFGSVPCETWPNRSFLHAGTSFGRLNNGDKLYEKSDPVPNLAAYAGRKSIFDILDSHHISWRIYQNSLGAPSLTGMQFWPHQYVAPLLRRERTTGTFQEFEQAARTGTLPSYSFIEPEFILGANDEHPGPLCDMRRGELLILRVWEALSNGPKWNNTLLIITYDEHGGCYDHVAPPATAVPPDDFEPQFKLGGVAPSRQFGPRVATVLVSPLIEAGTVFRGAVGGAEFDHTSILASLRDWLFTPENGYESLPSDWLPSARIAAAPTFWNVLTRSSPRTDKPNVGYWEHGAGREDTSAIDLANAIHSAMAAQAEIDRQVNAMTSADPAVEIDEATWKNLQARATAAINAAARTEGPGGTPAP
jgi:phospholipase C